MSQCTLLPATISLTISGVLWIMLAATAAGGGWHFGRWLIWLATHRIGQQT
jgi:hypothetical protein